LSEAKEIKKIIITTGNVRANGELNDSDTASRIWEGLPITGSCNTWGDEIYFSIPVKHKEENGKGVVEIGDLGYWPPGAAFCIFFGPTPVSKGNEIRPASPVNIIGRIKGDAKVFKSVSDGEEIRIEKDEIR